MPTLLTLQTIKANVYRWGRATVGAGRRVVPAGLVFQ